MTIDLTSPYQTKAHAFKGNLHAHSTESDGNQSPADAVTGYKNAGYHFAVLTDHDKVTTDPGVSGILYIAGIEESQGNHITRIKAATNDATVTSQGTINTGITEGSFLSLAHPVWPASPNQLACCLH